MLKNNPFYIELVFMALSVRCFLHLCLDVGHFQSHEDVLMVLAYKLDFSNVIVAINFILDHLSKFFTNCYLSQSGGVP